MAAPARNPARSSGGASRPATLPLRRALKSSPERRPGGPARPAAKPAPPRPRRRRRPAARGRGTRLGNRIRSIRLGALADRLLRGRLWVPLIGVLLTGIVFLNVALLEVNGSIARMDTRSAELRRDNAALRMRVARLGSSERIQRSAAARGFVAAAPGEVGYLSARPGDAPAAARALERWPAPQSSAAPASAESGADPDSAAASADEPTSAGSTETASGTSADDPSTAGETSSEDPTDSPASQAESGGTGDGTATP